MAAVAETVGRQRNHATALRAILLMSALAWITVFARAQTNDSRPVVNPQAGNGAAVHQFDANQLRMGRFSYRNTEQGADAGTSEIAIRKGSLPESFVFTNHVSGKFSQQWEAVAGTYFEPISAQLTFGDGNDRHVTFELKYAGQRVTGVFLPRNSHEKIKVDRDIPPDTVDQRLDWAAAISQIILVPGHTCTFHVFDPSIGDSLVTTRISGPETVHVPAGTFQAMRIIYKVGKASGAETYEVLTNSTGPRMLLKEEFPNGSVTELTSVQD